MPRMQVVTRLHIIIIVPARVSKESNFPFDNVGKEFASCLKFIEYALVCLFSIQLIRIILLYHHISAASNRLSSSFFKVHPSAPYVPNHWPYERFHQFHLDFFFEYFLMLCCSIAAFLALPILALVSSEQLSSCPCLS